MATRICRSTVQWKQLGTHNKHLSVLDFEKQERQKEVSQLEQDISGSREELAVIFFQQVKAEQETEQIMQQNEEVRQEAERLSVANTLLREQTDELTEDKEKLLSDNHKLEKEQKRLQQKIEEMANSKAVMERNIHAYDESKKWQLPDLGALTSAKAYRDKNALPLVEKLKTVVKSLTVKCVQPMEQIKKLTDKTERQASDIKWYKGKLKEQTGIIEQLQVKAADLERVKRYAGADKVQSMIDSMKDVEKLNEEQRRLQKNHIGRMSR